MYINSTYYKNQLEVFPEGCAVKISIKAKAIFVENVILGEHPFERCGDATPQKKLLKVNDPEQGVLWIDETFDTFYAKINAVVTAGVEKTKSIPLEIGNDPGQIAPGTTIVELEVLRNITIHRINYAKEEFVTFYGAGAQVPHNPTYSATTGTLDFTAATGGAGLVAGTSPISIVYNEN